MEDTNGKLDLLKEAIYEGYYDEVGHYCLTFREEQLIKSLKEIFNAKHIEILR